MDFERLFSSIQKMAPWLGAVDIVQFVLMYFGYKQFLKTKETIVADISTNYLDKLVKKVDSLVENLTSMNLDIVKHVSTGKAQFESVQKELNNIGTFNNKMMTKIDEIGKTQERHTFMFESQNSEMYNKQMRNIKTSAKEFFVDWKIRIHGRLKNTDWSKSLEDLYNEIMKASMHDLAEWTEIFRARIHPTHMAVIELEVNPQAIQRYADGLKSRVVPILKDLSNDKAFEAKSYDLIDTFLDKTYREWEDLMETTFRSKRANNKI